VLDKPPPLQDDATYGPHQEVENRVFQEEEEVLEELAFRQKGQKKILQIMTMMEMSI